MTEKEKMLFMVKGLRMDYTEHSEDDRDYISVKESNQKRDFIFDKQGNLIDIVDLKEG